MSRLFSKVVSLVGATERRRRIADQLDATGLAWSFFDAHTSIAPGLTIETTKLVRINGRPMQAGEFGCYSSHWSLLQAHANGPPGEVMLVFEDDAIIDPLFFSDQAELIRLGNKYGLLRLGGHLTAPSAEMEILGRRRIVRFKKRIHGTLGYLVSVDAAKKLLPHLSPIRRPIDVEYDRFWAHGVGIFSVYPFPALESYKESQVGARELRPLPMRDLVMWKALNAIDKARRAKANIFG